MNMATELDDITDLNTLRSVAKGLQRSVIEFKQYKERCRELENKLLLKEERIAELLRDLWSKTSEKLSSGEKDTQR
ncbi:hypothetical protein MASR2M78_17190 [Treponema sp.]